MWRRTLSERSVEVVAVDIAAAADELASCGNYVQESYCAAESQYDGGDAVGGG